MKHQKIEALGASVTRFSGLPLPYQPRGRSDALVAGLQRLERLREEMVAKLIAELDEMTADADLEPSLGFPEPRFIQWTTDYFPPDRPILPQDAGSTDDREEAEDDERTLGWERHGSQKNLGAGTNDLEPVLGWPERIDQSRSRQSATDHEDEPSLGAVNGTGPYADQRDWAQGGASDVEEEHDGRGPDVDDENDLGWTAHESCGTPHVWSMPTDGEQNLGASENRDQRAWVHPQPAELRCHDREEQCEDEGGQCDDEGHDSDTELDYADHG